MATVGTDGSAGAKATVNAREAAHFGALAAEWWDPQGSSAMLHRLNPVRMGYVRRAVDAHFGTDPMGLKPLAGRRVLDIGCGGGIASEALARLGGTVTGIDAAPEAIAAARAHAAATGLAIDYRSGDAAAMDLAGFDLVVALEVIEHAADPAAFVAVLAHALAAGGLLVMSTPNRTTLSRLLLVEAAERTGRIPRGTHDWDRFLAPDDLAGLLDEAGLEVTDTTGLGWDPLRGFSLGANRQLNYLVTAVHRHG